jgi:hypothetical protein
MKNFTLILISLALSLAGNAQQNTVKVDSRADGFRLMVDGREMMVNGMNWDYFPIGTNYSYSLWNQPDDFIKKALDDEMSLLRAMGVNAIRVYAGIPKKWIEYIYREHGIYTMLNHSFGRYGLTLDGAWVPNTDYSDPRVIQLLLSETKALAEEYKNTPGLLMYLWEMKTTTVSSGKVRKRRTFPSRTANPRRRRITCTNYSIRPLC